MYPQGANKPGGRAGWNTGSAGSGDEVEGVDDMAFVNEIASVFRASYGWVGRLYGYGSSNGGAVMQQIAVSASSPRQVPKSEESFASGIRQQQPPIQMIISPTNRIVHVIAAFSSFA